MFAPLLFIFLLAAIVCIERENRYANYERQERIIELEASVGIPPLMPSSPSIAGTVFRMLLMVTMICAIAVGLSMCMLGH